MRQAKKAVRKAAEARERDEAKKAARVKRGLPAQSPFDSRPRGECGQCALCLTEKRLVRSHTIPRIHYREGGDFYHLTDCEYGGKKQDDAVHLFCEECEGRFSAVEGPFVKWWKRLRLGSVAIAGERENVIDASGEWLCWPLRDSGAATVTIKDADLNLLRKMTLINIFRMQCRFSAWKDPVAAKLAGHFCCVVKEFMDCDERGDSQGAKALLAQFSIRAIYACLPIDGRTTPPLIKPFLGGVMGLYGYPDGGICCFIGPMVWLLYKKPDNRDRGDIQMECRDWREILPQDMIASARCILQKSCR